MTSVHASHSNGQKTAEMFTLINLVCVINFKTKKNRWNEKNKITQFEMNAAEIIYI
jgi:uncharacterized phage-like protein YoqJ